MSYIIYSQYRINVHDVMMLDRVFGSNPLIGTRSLIICVSEMAYGF